jgi:hypothetical protein
LKRFMFVVAALSAALTLSATALAGGGNGGTPPPTTGGSQGNGVSTVKYRSAYTDLVYGPISCAGVHQTGKNFGTYGQDSFTCESTTGNPLQAVAPGEALTLATTNGWYSDYYFFVASPGTVVLATSLTGVVSADGRSFTAAAIF